MIEISNVNDFESWRTFARSLLGERIHYQNVSWNGGGFLLGDTYSPVKSDIVLPVPSEFMKKALVMSAFRDDSNWALLYRLIYRLMFEDKKLMSNPLDHDVQEFEKRLRLVNRDMHKMKAFVRFREVSLESKTHYFSWYRPDHRIVRLIAPFFRDRFNGMNWDIMTEDECVTWDGKELSFSPGVERSALPHDDAEDLWKTYYSSIFNPARIKEGAMKKEMPVRYWSTMPETELISSLMQEAPERLEVFYDSQRTAALTKEFQSLDELRTDLSRCRSCGICADATAPVMGEGPPDARIVIVGEQPGNEEDLSGKPFQGPSGDLLDEILKKSGFKRSDLYVTNAVKGFKHVIINSFRKHRTALASEISACKPWLREELRLLEPELVICLGRSAAQSILGKMVKMESVRGKVITSPYSPKLVILPHPASILRADESVKAELIEKYLQEFIEVRRLLVS